MKNRKPNIVFVLTDDQGYGDLGCTGNPWIQTPNIDEFYGDSVRMTNYHVGTTCAPTRFRINDRTLCKQYRCMAYHRRQKSA